MKVEFNFSEASQLMLVLDNYKQLANHLSQISTEYKEKLDSIWKQNGKYEGQYWNSPVIQHWNEIDIHITSQMWGSTAKGWGGIGGSAMTSDYNYIIHQKFTDLIYVYWDGRLAYIVKKSDIEDMSNMPGLFSDRRNAGIEFYYKRR